MNSDPEFEATDYYQEILKCWEKDGALYEIAPYFGINALVGSQSTLKGRTSWTWKDFQDFCATLDDDVIAVRGLTQTELIRWVSSYALNDFVNLEEGTCSFDSDEFISLLQFAKTMPVEEELLEDIDIAQGRCALLPWGLSSVQDYAYYARLYPDGFSLIGFPANEGGVCAVCADTFGLGTSENAYSGGWAFLKFLLSDEAQVEIWGEMGWPISKSAMETLLEEAQLPVDNERSPFYGLENAQPLTANDAARIQEYIQMVDKIYSSDETILTILEEETESLFSGDKSEKAVADIIQNRVGIYLAEQS
jgi:ABC-type glycerol-3-phosphate transport system substrate-binding protein